MTLPALVRKAAGDAGFDLPLGSDGEWQRMGVSGTPHVVWILSTGGSVLLAVKEPAVLQEFGQTTWTEVPLPSQAAGAVRCRSADELLRSLHRTRMLLAQLPPGPEHEFAQRLKAVDSTEAEAMVRRRVGQGLYREMLMDYWDGRCAVTGLAVPELLRASHAKPWKDSDDRERLDVYNGLLLAVHLDALFDQGFITVDPGGTLRCSPAMPADALDLLVPDIGEQTVERLTDMHQPYLAYHRAYVFKASADSPGPPTRYAIHIIARIQMDVVRSSYEARQRFAGLMRDALAPTGTTIQAVRSAIRGDPEPLDNPDPMAFDEERAESHAQLQIQSGPRPTRSAGYPVAIDAAIPVEVLGRPAHARAAFRGGIRDALSHVGVKVDDIASASGMAPDPLVVPDYGAY